MRLDQAVSSAAAADLAAFGSVTRKSGTHFPARKELGSSKHSGQTVSDIGRIDQTQRYQIVPNNLYKPRSWKEEATGDCQGSLFLSKSTHHTSRLPEVALFRCSASRRIAIGNNRHHVRTTSPPSSTLSWTREHTSKVTYTRLQIDRRSEPMYVAPMSWIGV